jgi:hypothetical protein
MTYQGKGNAMMQEIVTKTGRRYRSKRHQRVEAFVWLPVMLLFWVGVVVLLVEVLPAIIAIGLAILLFLFFIFMRLGRTTAGTTATAVALQPLAAEPRRECPHCRESMRRDARVCPHCRSESEPWMFHENRWWAKSDDGAWWWRDEARGEWVAFTIAVTA